jgi:hypothetical protein
MLVYQNTASMRVLLDTVLIVMALWPCLVRQRLTANAFLLTQYQPTRYLSLSSQGLIRWKSNSFGLPSRRLLSHQLDAAEKPLEIRHAVEAWEKDLNEAQMQAVTKPLYSVTRVVAGECPFGSFYTHTIVCSLFSSF